MTNTRPRSTSVRGYLLIRFGQLLFAATLLLSAWLKAENPYPAAANLAWTGWPSDQRVLAIDIAGILESLVAGALLLYPHTIVARRTAFGMAGILLALHLSSMMTTGTCGCFGDHAVPDWITVSALIIGASSTVHATLRPLSFAGPALRMTSLVGIAISVTIPLWNRTWLPQSPSDQLVAHAALPRTSEKATFIVGSWGCSHCVAELRKLDRKRRSTPSLPADHPIYFVTRESDVERPRGGFAWLRPLAISDALWWQLIPTTPPAIIHYDRDSTKVARPSD